MRLGFDWKEGQTLIPEDDFSWLRSLGFWLSSGRSLWPPLPLLVMYLAGHFNTPRKAVGLLRIMIKILKIKLAANFILSTQFDIEHIGNASSFNWLWRGKNIFTDENYCAKISCRKNCQMMSKFPLKIRIFVLIKMFI